MSGSRSGPLIEEDGGGASKSTPKTHEILTPASLNRPPSFKEPFKEPLKEPLKEPSEGALKGTLAPEAPFRFRQPRPDGFASGGPRPATLGLPQLSRRGFLQGLLEGSLSGSLQRRLRGLGFRG